VPLSKAKLSSKAQLQTLQGDNTMKHKFLSNRERVSIIAVIALLIALTIIGSFYDYKISNSLYLGQQPNENPFGILFAFIGIAPTFVGWSFLGASIICLSKKQTDCKINKKCLTAFAIFLFVLSFFYFCNTLTMVNSSAFSVHWAIGYPIGIATLLLASVLGYKMSKRSENPELLKKVLLLSIVSVAVMVVIMSTKGIMGRPRFRFVLEYANPDYFRNWWQSGKDIKASFGNAAVGDEFASFPSGHSAYSMFAIFLFPAFADYNGKLKKQKGLLAFLGLAWWCLTALSRITVGAHYLTDVCIAALVTVIAWLAVNKIDCLILKKRNTH
jgi:membrane-associated phospholipid phosphatase